MHKDIYFHSVSPCQSHTQFPCCNFWAVFACYTSCVWFCVSPSLCMLTCLCFVDCECENSKWRGSVKRLKMTAVLKNVDNSTPALLNSILFPQNGLLCHYVTRAKMESTSEQLHSHAFTQNRRLCDWANGAKMESTFQSSHPVQLHNKHQMDSQLSRQKYLTANCRGFGGGGLKLLINGWIFQCKSKHKVGGALNLYLLQQGYFFFISQ